MILNNFIIEANIFISSNNKMEKNNVLNDVFYSYPKSTNHNIFITKKDKFGICDLNSNCTELNFSIKKNKKSIFNNNKIDNFTYVNLNNLQNYNIIILFLMITLFIVLIFHLKK
jgi:hypothetical protein